MTKTNGRNYMTGTMAHTAGQGLSSQPYPPLITPKWWTGSYPDTVNPEEIIFDCNGKLPPANQEFKEKVNKVFDRKGVVWVQNTGAESLTELQDYVDLAIGDQKEYKGGANARSGLEANFLEVGAPAIADLHYHHEMSYVDQSVTRLCFTIVDTLDKGRGYTYMSDQVGVTDELLETELGQKLKDKGICYHRHLTDATAYEGQDESSVYNHWQRSFMTDDPYEAQHAAESMGLQVTWGKDWQGKGRYMKTKCYIDAYEYAPMLDRNLIYASIADHHSWFDTWPGIANLHPDDRHLLMTFGDDSEISYQEWCQWVNLNDKYGFPIEYKKGDFVMFCNYRMAHGRPGYDIK